MGFFVMCFILMTSFAYSAGKNCEKQVASVGSKGLKPSEGRVKGERTSVSPDLQGLARIKALRIGKLYGSENRENPLW